MIDKALMDAHSDLAAAMGRDLQEKLPEWLELARRIPCSDHRKQVDGLLSREDAFVHLMQCFLTMPVMSMFKWVENPWSEDDLIQLMRHAYREGSRLTAIQKTKN
jgi:hypothetical protein